MLVFITVFFTQTIRLLFQEIYLFVDVLLFLYTYYILLKEGNYVFKYTFIAKRYMM